MAAPTILAAGVLCWRETEEGVKVLLVRRAEYDDLTVPKGKLEPGELLPETAVRELLEETCVPGTLGATIGNVRYTVKGAPKFVQYWLAEVSNEVADAAAAAFAPNEEISAAEWFPIAEAAKQATYPHDTEMIGDLAKRLALGTARTFSIIVLRHAKAIPPDSWDGPDATRPLLHRGLEQAIMLAPAVTAFGPDRLVSSPATRCLTTIEPIARLADLPVKTVNGISQDAQAAGRSGAAKQAAKRLRKAQNVVLCTHGPVIPELVAAIREATAPVGRTTTASAAAQREMWTRASSLATGDFVVFHVAPGEQPRLIDVELHAAG